MEETHADQSIKAWESEWAPRRRGRDGGRGSLPASYANFFVANGAVLVPTFGEADDERAVAILAEVFAGRDVIGISRTGSGKTLAFLLPGMIHIIRGEAGRGRTAPKRGVCFLASSGSCPTFAQG